ncbi:MAG: hypothetical protein KKF16_02335 [Euryarchaeota archaeon]|nr:hypothetical protein [Euryarchaeota archaeon]MBU4607136.1 hypothetical protein [Euryarchaeota archaeon]MBV1729896.1 hypothetical protein [Methanobacterium sp.]MBV1755529.1 hypothetical protein [Methanobacterium sp.]
MRIVTTPMCEPILKWAGVSEYMVNKNPDEEEADLAIVLSETNTRMKSIKIKLNTFFQIRKSVERLQNMIEVENSSNFSEKRDLNIKNSKNNHLNNLNFKNQFMGRDSKWLDNDYRIKARKLNGKIKVTVYSNFLKDIVEDMGYSIVYEKPDFVVYPDYLESVLETKSEGNNLIKVPSHENASLNPVKRAHFRYNLLEKKLCMKP